MNAKLMRGLWAVGLAAAVSGAWTLSIAGEHPTGGKEHPAGAAAAAPAEHPAAPAADKTTMTGEIVDLACYLGHGAKGAKHAKCAATCVLGGAPAGLLTADGSLYLLVEDHNAPKPYKAACKMAGANASITGEKKNSGGLQAIMVTDAKKAG